jgi:hypothetical protein
MRNKGLFVILLALVATTGCASSEEWNTWYTHRTHFASGDHMSFSLKNQGQTPRVSAGDSRLAASQSWWGQPVVVRADQIFQN